MVVDPADLLHGIVEAGRHQDGPQVHLNASSAMRAERFEERTAEKVATASTSVPTAVANDAMVAQSVVAITAAD